MSSRTLTAWLLIAGPLCLVLGLGVWFTISGNVDQTDAQAVVQMLGEKGDRIKPFGLLGMLGWLLVLGGLGGVRASMEGGPGHPIAGLGFLLMIIGAAGGIAEGGFYLGTADAAAEGANAVAAALYASSQAVGAASTAAGFVGYAIVGWSILVQKNYHAAIGALIVVGGAVGAIVASVDYQSQLMIIPYMAWVILSLVMGIFTLRSDAE